MDVKQRQAVLTVALMAAFADGMKDDRERAAVKRVADALGSQAGFDLPAVYREVLLSKPDLTEVAATLDTAALRQLAYEMAVGVCDADGACGPAEREFLNGLADVLRIGRAEAAVAGAQADEIADAAFEDVSLAASSRAGAPAEGAPAAPAGPGPQSVAGTVVGRSSLPDAELDQLILNASVTNAALELLPESIASMAIIPLQMRLVYRIGRSYGYAMDMSHAKDFIATLGVGLTGQYLEQIGRRLLGGLLGSVGGGLGRGLGRQAASSGMTFATTYAIGRVAQRYYSTGRQLDTEALKQAFAGLLDEARGLMPRYRNQIEQKAATIDTRSLASLVRQS